MRKWRQIEQGGLGGCDCPDNCSYTSGPTLGCEPWEESEDRTVQGEGPVSVPCRVGRRVH